MYVINAYWPFWLLTRIKAAPECMGGHKSETGLESNSFPDAPKSWYHFVPFNAHKVFVMFKW